MSTNVAISHSIFYLWQYPDIHFVMVINSSSSLVHRFFLDPLNSIEENDCFKTIRVESNLNVPRYRKKQEEKCGKFLRYKTWWYVIYI